MRLSVPYNFALFSSIVLDIAWRVEGLAADQEGHESGNTTLNERVAYIDHLWPNNVVYFAFAPTFVEKNPTTVGKLTSAMRRIATVSCIRFRNRRSNNRYYLLYANREGKTDCHATVGYGTTQPMIGNFGSDCTEGNIVHELFHSLGFFHEQARDDRDTYVRINTQNIMAGKADQFKRAIERGYKTTTYNLPYNYESIMHYSPKEFSRNERNTIDAKPNPWAKGNPKKMGQRHTITPLDATMINARYCPSTSIGRDPGARYPEPNDGTDDGIGGVDGGGDGEGDYGTGCIIICQAGDIDCETLCRKSL